MKRFIAGLAIAASVVFMPSIASARSVSEAVCQEAIEGNLKPYLKFMVEQPRVDEDYYLLFRALVFEALTQRCPSQFSKIYALVDGYTAETVPVEDYRLFYLITGLESQYD